MVDNPTPQPENPPTSTPDMPPPPTPTPETPSTPTPPTIPPPNPRIKDAKPYNWSVIILSLLLLVAIGFAGYFGYLYTQLSEQPPVVEEPISTPTPDPITSWETYTNTKLGFTIQYPESLNIIPIEADPKAENREYIRKCESGEIVGCGRSRYPDFRIDFQINEGTNVFAITVYQHPTKEYGLGDVEKDTFTYGVSVYSDNLSNFSLEEQEALSEQGLLSKLEFIEPDKPLLCLWDTELGPGFDPVDDKDYIDENIEDLTLFSGYYLNPSTNTCSETEFYSWSHQQETDKPPFETEQECKTTCFTE